MEAGQELSGDEGNGVADRHLQGDRDRRRRDPSAVGRQNLQRLHEAEGTGVVDARRGLSIRFRRPAIVGFMVLVGTVSGDHSRRMRPGDRDPAFRGVSRRHRQLGDDGLDQERANGEPREKDAPDR